MYDNDGDDAARVLMQTTEQQSLYGNGALVCEIDTNDSGGRVLGCNGQSQFFICQSDVDYAGFLAFEDQGASCDTVELVVY